MTPRGEMPFLDHLEELRWRILWSLVAILVGTIVGWFLLDKIDIIDVLKRPIAPYLPGGRETAAAVLLQRDIVHLIGTWARGIARGADRRSCRGIRIRLLGSRLDAGSQLGNPLLADPRELLEIRKLLLHGQQLGAQIASHLHEIRLLGSQRLLQQPDGGHDRVPFRRPRRIALREISP